MQAHEIKAALARRHTKDVFLTEVKTGPTWYAPPGELKVLDAVAIKRSWSGPCIVAYEVKITRANYRDRGERMLDYLPYCHRFYVACPKGLIRPEEVPAEVGLVWVRPTETTSVVRPASHREIELPWTMFYHLVISHMQSDRRPGPADGRPVFFSSQREFLEGWVKDKRLARRRLGEEVRSKLLREREELLARVEDLEHRARSAEDKCSELLEALAENDIKFNQAWQAREAIREALGKPNRHVLATARSAYDHIASFLKAAGERDT